MEARIADKAAGRGARLHRAHLGLRLQQVFTASLFFTAAAAFSPCSGCREAAASHHWLWVTRKASLQPTSWVSWPCAHTGSGSVSSARPLRAPPHPWAAGKTPLLVSASCHPHLITWPAGAQASGKGPGPSFTSELTLGASTYQ